VTLPTFLIIGAQKAGTTSLYRYLRDHPQVYMPKLKEPDFFVAERTWSRGLEWYEALYQDANGVAAVGEASTTYTMFPTYKGVPARIAGVLPDVRLIYLLRDPIERMRSDYLHYANPPRRAKYMTKERRPVERALLEEPRYLDGSRYAMQIERYHEHFPVERLLVITSEELRHRRDAVIRRTFEFIGVDPTFEPPTLQQEYNTTERAPRALDRIIHQVPGFRTISAATPGSVKRFAAGLTSRRIDPSDSMISPEIRHRLEDLLRDDVRRLRPYMAEDFDGWGMA
jgi:Sulfotransferase domain